MSNLPKTGRWTPLVGLELLATCGTAMFAGVMLTIGVSFAGYWQSLPANDFLEWFARHSHFVAKPIPFVVLPMLVGLAGSLYYARGSGAFGLWIASSCCAVAVLLITVVYFVPSNRAFASGAVDVADVSSRLDQWALVHLARISLGIVASALAVLAVSRRSSRGGG